MSDGAYTTRERAGFLGAAYSAYLHAMPNRLISTPELRKIEEMFVWLGDRLMDEDEALATEPHA